MKRTPSFELDNLPLGSILAPAILDRCEQVRDHERARLETINLARIASLKMRLRSLSEERNGLQEEISQNPREPLSRLGIFGLVLLAVTLFATSFAATVYSIEPFGFGSLAWAFAAGVCCVGAYTMHVILDRFGIRPLVGAIAATSLGAVLYGQFLLAEIRGDQLVLQMSAVMEVGAEQGIAPGNALRFYADTSPKLRTFLALVSVATELALGLALWQFGIAVSGSAAIGRQARLRLTEVENEMANGIEQLNFLENEGAVFEHEFNRDLHLSLLREVRDRGIARFAIVALLAAGMSASLNAQDRVVVLLDLSGSMKRQTFQGSLKDLNLAAATQVIDRLEPGTQFTAIAITGDSFSNPALLASGHLPLNRGALSLLDQVGVGRARLKKTLSESVARMPVDSRTTDVFGAIVVAVERLQSPLPGRRRLVLLGDLRHYPRPVDLETPTLIDPKPAMERLRRVGLVPDLRGVTVDAMGVHAMGKDVRYWQSLRNFWAAYFTEAGAEVRTYSVGYDVGDSR